MNYETAKKLKDAGFPQEYNGGDFVLHSFNEDETGITSANDAYAPTLEELIEACGDAFALFGPNKRFTPLEEEMPGVYYEKYESQLQDWTALKRDAEIVQKGLTPIEAVANLWLALNTPPLKAKE